MSVSVAIRCHEQYSYKCKSRHGRDRMVVGFITTYTIDAYHHWRGWFKSRSGRGVQHYMIKLVSYLRQFYILVDIMFKLSFHRTYIMHALYNDICKGSWWVWSDCSWIYNFLCNQWLSPLSCEFGTTLYDKVCQWLVAC
jgi:hypothetical protein